VHGPGSFEVLQGAFPEGGRQEGIAVPARVAVPAGGDVRRGLLNQRVEGFFFAQRFFKRIQKEPQKESQESQ